MATELGARGPRVASASETAGGALRGAYEGFAAVLLARTDPCRLEAKVRRLTRLVAAVVSWPARHVEGPVRRAVTARGGDFEEARPWAAVVVVAGSAHGAGGVARDAEVNAGTAGPVAAPGRLALPHRPGDVAMAWPRYQELPAPSPRAPRRAGRAGAEPHRRREAVVK